MLIITHYNLHYDNYKNVFEDCVMRQLVKRAIQRVGPVVMGSAAATWDFYDRNREASRALDANFGESSQAPDREFHVKAVERKMKSVLRPQLQRHAAIFSSDDGLDGYGELQYLIKDPSGYGLAVKTVINCPNLKSQYKTVYAWMDREVVSFTKLQPQRAASTPGEFRANIERVLLAHELTHAEEYHTIITMAVASMCVGLKAASAGSLLKMSARMGGPRLAALVMPLLGLMHYIDCEAAPLKDLSYPKYFRVPLSARPVIASLNTYLEVRADRGAVAKIINNMHPVKAKRTLGTAANMFKSLAEAGENYEEDDDLCKHPSHSYRAEMLQAAVDRLSV